MAQDLDDLDLLVDTAYQKGFEVEENVDYGAGPIDLVWSINIHPGLPDIKCGFVVLRADEGGNHDWEDNQFSLRKIEEAAMRGIRSGLDKVYLIAENEEMAKSVSGKIEWLASHGSLLRLDAVSLGISLDQEGSSVITPSQQRVPQGEKIRKRDIHEREAKIERHNRPAKKKRVQESEQKKALRESRIDRHSRPKEQKLREEEL